MVRLADLSEGMRTAVTSVAATPMDPLPWVDVPDVSARTISIVSSAGLGLRSQAPFKGGEGGYRAIPHDAPAGDIIMSHISVNYDRTGYQQDLETILPRARLSELAGAGRIGSVASTHYSFMGATDPKDMEDDARALGREMLSNGTDTALLLPV